MMVKNTCKNRFTAFISTANRYSHASPDIIVADLLFTSWKASGTALIQFLEKKPWGFDSEMRCLENFTSSCDL